jgi:hypothetical protein
VLGDSGAPLEAEEVEILQQEYPRFAAYMKPEGVRAVEAQGFAALDSDNDLGTPLIDGKECAYSCFDKQGVCYCAIERAWRDGQTTFRKPISCWLYPIRIKQLSETTALNYDRQSMCKCACAKGKRANMPVFRFLREPLEHRFGKAFYEEMEKVGEELKSLQPSKRGLK